MDADLRRLLAGMSETDVRELVDSLPPATVQELLHGLELEDARAGLHRLIDDLEEMLRSAGVLDGDDAG